MKRDETDNQISAMLKKQLPADGSNNEWFTRKVLNRLPPKPRSNYAAAWIAIYVIWLAICLGGWMAFAITLTSGVILVKDVLTFIALIAATALLLFNIVGHTLREA